MTNELTNSLCLIALDLTSFKNSSSDIGAGGEVEP